MAEKCSRNPVKILQRFSSYLEKHRIFEMFQELTTMLLIKKPEDHLSFLKQSLYHAAQRLDVPRIIFLTPPDFDIKTLAEKLKNKVNAPVITNYDVINYACDPAKIHMCQFMQNLKMILRDYMMFCCDGWIFSDFPRTYKEAQFLQRCGIIPSHVFEIISFDKKHENAYYYREIHGLRQIYSNLITPIHIQNKKFKDIVDECLSSIKCKTYQRTPSIFRILIVDFSNSSICKRLGQYLERRFNVVNIDFEYILDQISLRETDLGYLLKAYLHDVKSYDLIPIEIRIQAFETFLYESESFKKGWVLTGFINTVEDFKQLDMTDAPPNRVFIIKYRAESETESNQSKECNCKYEEIIKYSGESIYVIEDYGNLEVIKEKVEFFLMKPPPCVAPRKPRNPTPVTFENIEFDPDDEPNTDIFADIRASEPIINLI